MRHFSSKWHQVAIQMTEMGGCLFECINVNNRVLLNLEEEGQRKLR